MERSSEQIRAGRRALHLTVVGAATAAALAFSVNASAGNARASGPDVVLALGLLAVAWVLDAAQVKWGSDRAGQVQAAVAVNTVLFPAAILLPPVLFMAVAVASAASYARSTTKTPLFVGNACIRIADMSVAAVTFHLLAGDSSLNPADLRTVVALTAAGFAMLLTENVILVALTRAWEGLDSREAPMWPWASLLPEVQEVLVGVLFCLLYPTPATVLVVGLIAASQHALHQQASSRAAARDDKTGLLSLPAFQELAASELGRAQRTGHPVAVLLMDLDGLKRVNTDHGHLAGDEHILAMAALLADASRSYDLVARFGGDEFCVMLPDTSLPEATTFAERIRTSATSTRIPRTDTTMAVSIGLAQAEPADDIMTLLARADAALRHAKTHNRNQVVVAAPSGQPAAP